MLLNSTQQDKHRADGHKSKHYLSIQQPVVLLTAQVDGVFLQGTEQINFDSGTSIDTARIRPGMRVEITTADGVEVATLAAIVPSGSSPNITGTITLFPHAIALGDNNVITIYERYDPVVLPPTFDSETGVSRKRRQTFSGQTNAPGPVVRAGIHRHGFVRDGSIVFTLSGSARTFNGATMTTWSWECTGGVIASSSSQNTTLTITTPGQYWLYLTGTDSNGKTDTVQRHVWAHDPDPDDGDYPYTEFSSTPITISDDGSGRVSLKVTGISNFTTFRDGVLIQLWEETWYGNEAGSITLIQDDENGLLFTGYIISDSIEVDSEHGVVTFEAQSVPDLCKSLPMQALSIHGEAVVQYWFQGPADMTMDEMIYWLVYWHTTLMQVTDWYLSGNALFKKLFKFNEGGLYNQVRDLAGKLLATVVGNKAGQIYIRQDIQMLDVAGRAAIDIVTDITNRDWKDIMLIERQHLKEVAVSYASGFYYDGGNQILPYCSIAPTKIRHITGSGKNSIEGLILADQDECDHYAGRMHAVSNLAIKGIRIQFAGNYSVIDVAPPYWWQISLASDDTPRGITLTNHRIKVKSCTIHLDTENGTTRVDATFQPEAFGPDGVPDPCATAGEINLADVGQPVWGAATTYSALASGSSIRQLTDGNPNWTVVDSSTYLDIEIDPFWVQKQGTSNPDYILYLAVAAGEIARLQLNQTKVVLTPVQDPPNTWSEATTVANVTFFTIVSSKFSQDLHVVLGRYQNGSNQWRGWLAFTENDGVTWEWGNLYDSSPPTELRPLYVAINRDYILVTIWDSTGGGRLALVVFDTAISYVDTFDLGTATSEEVDNLTYWAFPVIVLDDPDLWHIAGRMSSPQSLSDPEHIIGTDDTGTGWFGIEDSWGASRCVALHISRLVDDQREFRALKRGAAVVAPSSWSTPSPSPLTSPSTTDRTDIFQITTSTDRVYQFVVATGTLTELMDFTPPETGVRPYICMFKGNLYCMSWISGSTTFNIWEYDLVSESWSNVYSAVHGSHAITDPAMFVVGSDQDELQLVVTLDSGSLADLVLYSSDGTTWNTNGTYEDETSTTHRYEIVNGTVAALKHSQYETTRDADLAQFRRNIIGTETEHVFRWDGVSEFGIEASSISWTFLHADSHFYWRDNGGTFEYSTDFISWTAPVTQTVTPMRSINMPVPVGWSFDSVDGANLIHYWNIESGDWGDGEVVDEAATSMANGLSECMRMSSGIIWVLSQRSGGQVWFTRDEAYPGEWPADSGGGSNIDLTFYQDVNGVSTERSVLPFTDIITPGSMAVRKDGVVAIGNGLVEDVMIVQGSPADDYAEWQDITADHGANPVQKLRWSDYGP